MRTITITIPDNAAGWLSDEYRRQNTARKRPQQPDDTLIESRFLALLTQEIARTRLRQASRAAVFGVQQETAALEVSVAIAPVDAQLPPNPVELPPEPAVEEKPNNP